MELAPRGETGLDDTQMAHAGDTSICLSGWSLALFEIFFFFLGLLRVSEHIPDQHLFRFESSAV